MSIAFPVAPQRSPMQLPVNVRQRAVICVAAVAVAALVLAGVPNLWLSHAGDTHHPHSGDGIASMSIANSAQGLTASFGLGGATVRADGARFTLGLTAFGRGAQVVPVAPVRPRLGDGMIRYAYSAAVTETWQRRSVGLEQGFVLSRRLAGSGPLVLAMAAPAASRLVRGAVSLPGGLSYAGLRATDARGRVLHSWLALTGGQLLIKVADRGAHYPVRIDPLVQQAGLAASDGAVGDYVGNSVAVSGNTLVAGAPYHKVGANPEQGAVYVFTGHSGHWKQTAELTVADGAADQFLGSAVAISGNTIVASAPYTGTASEGALFVFSERSGHWKQIAELTASDNAPGEQLGHYSVAIQGKTIIAGAPEHTVGSVAGQGGVYVYYEPPGGWVSATQNAVLTERHGALDDWVGWSVGISGNTIVAGAPAPYNEDGHESAVFVFTKRSGHWKQTAELHQRDVATVDDIGRTVAVSGHMIAITVPGALYVFQYLHGKWKQTSEVAGCDGAAVAFDGGAILASLADSGPDKAGAYLAKVLEYREFSGKWRQVSSVTVGRQHPSKQGPLTESLASSGSTIVAGLFNAYVAGSVAVLKGRVTSEGPLIGQVTSSEAGEVQVPVTCELPARSTCRVTVSLHRAGSKQVLGHAKPKSIRGTDIRTITVHLNAAFEHLLVKPHGVKAKFTVREYLHGKLKDSGSTTITFTAEQ